MYILKTIRVSGVAVKVYRSAEFNTFVVRLFIDGAERIDASYETDDKQDAVGTAITMFRQAWEQRDEVSTAIATFLREMKLCCATPGNWS